MSILGKLAKGTGYLACGLGGFTIGFTGSIIGGIGKAVVPESQFFDGVKVLSNKAGNALIDASSSVGNFAESAVDATFKISGDIGGGIAGGIAEIAGANYANVEKAKSIGRVVGGVAVGLVAGDIIGGAVTTVAGAGIAGTGTAISSLHGAPATSAILSNIGGGTLLSGGAGVAGGCQVLNTINMACAADGGIKAITSAQTEEYLNDNNYIYDVEV